MIRFAEAIALQRAFGFSAEELAAIAKARTDYASELARGSAFARALGLSTTDATTLSSRLEVTSGAARTENDPFGWASDELERMRAIVDGRVSVAALDEFLRHEGPTASASIPTDAALTASWNAIRASKSNASESTERAIIEECSRVLRAPEPVVDYLCKSCFAVGGASLFDTIVADASESAPSYFEDALRRATKLVALRSLLGVDDDAFEHFVRWLKRRGFAFDAIAIEVCEDHPEGLVEHIVEAAKAKVICDSLGLRSASLYEVLAVVPETGAIDRIAFEARVAALLGAQPALIYHVTDKLGITANSIGGAVPWRSTRGIEAVRRALRLMNATGATQIDALQSWMSFSTQSIADAIASAARAKLGDDAFASAAIAAADAMRTRQRDALVAYLVHALGLRSAGDLYTRLLVDVEMSPCMLTTRVLHATSCVQNLLQRASMNLDAAAKWTELETKPAMARVTLTSDDARTWGWMKNYRVWEAARRVLLYPENYVEPELRTDATPAFDDLTRVLEQGDLDERATENAFRAYLRSLEEVSSLDVCAMTVEPRGDKHKIFHVFGRTRTTPRTYHYCSYDSLSGWSAWQATKLDVGDSHIVPVVFAGRLYVYWPVFIEQALEGEFDVLPDGTTKRQRKCWEVRIAGARFEDQRWTQPFVSDVSFMAREQHPKRAYSVRPEVTDGVLKLSLFAAQSHHDPEQPMSEFEVCHGSMTTHDGRLFTSATNGRFVVWHRQYSAPTHTEPFESRLVNDGVAAVLSIPYVDGTGSLVGRSDVLTANERGFALVQPADARHFVGAHPFFYVDSERAYFMLPSPAYLLEARRLGTPALVTPENAERLLGEHDRSGFIQLSDVPRFGELGSGVFSGRMSDIARNPRTLDPNAGRGRFQIPATIPATPGLVVRREPITGVGARAGLVGFDTGAVVSGLLSSSAPPAPVLAQSPLRFRVVRFDHPFVNRLRSQLERYGVDALFAPPEGSDTSLLRQQTTINDFAARYAPTTAVSQPLPVARFDFNNESPNSAYNWELFFYAPWTIANRLRSQQKFEQALRWMRFIFDPMDAGTATGPERFWRFKPLADDVRSSDARTSLLELLDYAGDDAARVQRRIEAERMIARWRRDPFDPHNIARTRLVAYERAIAMRTVEMLIEWGDNAFRRATRESVQEAAQLYVTAASLLGRRPEKLPERTGTPPKSYDELRAAPPSGAIAALEAMLPPSELGADDVSASDASTAVGPSLMYADGTYFCVPMNDELTRFWDIVADRLFKLRHCKDIDGASLDLPLYEPPIDPRLLVRARSLGMSIADVLSDASPAAQSPYRFTYLLSRALDFTNDVRSMGATLLSVIEKRDAEELAQVRQTIEREMSTAIRRVREQQVDEARAQRATLDQSRATVQRRIDYFRALIKKGLNTGESTHLQSIEEARVIRDILFGIQSTSGVLSTIPEFSAGTAGLGPEATVKVGGPMFARYVDFAGILIGHEAEVATHEGNIANLTGGFERRKADWEHQLSQSESELIGVDRQIAAADIRVAIAENELRNHELAFAHSERTERFLTSKFSSRALYDWMVRRLTVLHRQAYVLAFDLARKAQVAFALELGDESSTLFVRFGQWDSQRSGLLSGDELHADLRRMETAFMDRNERPYEITKTVSLATLDPVALVKLRSTGECHVTMPEAIFDVDHPDHVRRVIRSVSVTVPSVSSAFDSVPMKVTLASGKVRFSAAPPIARSAKVNSIVLSHGQNDSGLFETNLRDERLLPFEGAGLIDSEWQLSLPQERAFDYDSIADVVFTIRYTAKTGAARSNIRAALDSASRNGSNTLTGDTTGGFLMLSMKDDLPAEWQGVPLEHRGDSHDDRAAHREPVSVHRRASELAEDPVGAPRSRAPSKRHQWTARHHQAQWNHHLRASHYDGRNEPGAHDPASTPAAAPGADAGTWTITTDSTNGPHLNDNDHSDLILIVRYTMT
jgi:hypothetical protein